MRDRAHDHADAAVSLPLRAAGATSAPQPEASSSMPPVRHRSRPVLVISNDPPAAHEAAGGQPVDASNAAIRHSDALAAVRAVPAPDAPRDKPDYTVGYGKPPAATRFRKGQSGNPRGRPKKADSAAQLLRKQLATMVVAKVDGRSKKMSLLEAGLAQQVKQFLGGDKKTFTMFMSMLGEMGGPAGGRRQAAEPPEPEPEPASLSPLDASGRAALADYRREQLLSDGYSAREVDSILVTMGLVTPAPTPAKQEEDDDVVI